ncbi:MAG: hypothetical protein KatS3mg105_3319 [Gemmatales bacterium]|nr:MAG: hypothetical protein KatS3mg105_3319 [Gemmatales bacterium]
MRIGYVIFCVGFMAWPARAAPPGTWETKADGYEYLTIDGTIVGAYDPAGYWWPKIGGAYDEADVIEYHRHDLDRRNQGLAEDWLNSLSKRKGETITIGGKTATLDEARKLIAQSRIPEYAKAPRLTVISDDASLRERVLKDFQTSQALAPFRGKVLVDALSPDAWQLEPLRIRDNPNFQKTGVALIFQGKPDDKGRAKPFALWTYPGPEALAAALRQAGPNYDPKSIPSLPSGLRLIRFWPTWCLLGMAAIVALVLLWPRKRKGSL